MLVLGFLGVLFLILLAGVLVGLVAGAAAGRRRRSEARRALGEHIDAIAAEFPAEVRAWGGRAALQDPERVRALVERLESEGG